MVPEAYTKDDYSLFLANIEPTIQRRVAEQCENCKLKMLDTMNYWIESTPDALKKTFEEIDALVINEGEATLLTGHTNMILAAEELFLPHFKILIIPNT